MSKDVSLAQHGFAHKKAKTLFFFKKYLFLFLAVLGLLACKGFLVLASRGYSYSWSTGLLIAMAFLVAEHRL